MRSVFIVDVIVAVNRVNSSIIAVEKHDWSPFALLSSNRVIRAAVHKRRYFFIERAWYFCPILN
jgi:hypothetical protein